METYFYSKKLSATTTEQSLTLPQLRDITIINIGDYNVQIEPDNSIDDDSPVLPVGMSLLLGADHITLKYKATEGTATIYLYGYKHEKS
jgi:hypothetical protein